MTEKIIDINEVAIRAFTTALRPDDLKIRAQLDFGYSFDGKVAMLFEIRPVWNDPSKILELPYAKIRFNKTAQDWKLYWLRGSGNWVLYEKPIKSVHIGRALDIVKEDKHGCFYG